MCRCLCAGSMCSYVLLCAGSMCGTVFPTIKYGPTWAHMGHYGPMWAHIWDFPEKKSLFCRKKKHLREHPPASARFYIYIYIYISLYILLFQLFLLILLLLCAAMCRVTLWWVTLSVTYSIYIYIFLYIYIYYYIYNYLYIYIYILGAAATLKRRLAASLGGWVPIFAGKCMFWAKIQVSRKNTLFLPKKKPLRERPPARARFWANSCQHPKVSESGPPPGLKITFFAKSGLIWSQIRANLAFSPNLCTKFRSESNGNTPKQ